jgi:hypothetical protein
MDYPILEFVIESRDIITDVAFEIKVKNLDAGNGSLYTFQLGYKSVLVTREVILALVQELNDLLDMSEDLDEMSGAGTDV